jgi:hypothetical protein
MKTTCIEHPTKEPLIVIRQWQIEACDGDTCAAALLSFFEYWHNIKLETSAKSEQANRVAKVHGEEGSQDTTLFQFHNGEELKIGILGIYAERNIREAIKALASKQFISIHRNPNPRYKYDNTKHFLFNPDEVNGWLQKYRNGAAKIPAVYGKNTGLSGKNAGTIPETTSETTSETTEDIPPASADGPQKKPKAQPHPDHKEFIETWTTRYKEHFQMPYKFSGGRDGKAVKELLALKVPVAALVAIAAAAWRHSDGQANGKEWFWAKQSVTICGFAARFNEIASEVGTVRVAPTETTVTYGCSIDLGPDGKPMAPIYDC